MGVPFRVSFDIHHDPFDVWLASADPSGVLAAEAREASRRAVAEGGRDESRVMVADVFPHRNGARIVVVPTTWAQSTLVAAPAPNSWLCRLGVAVVVFDVTGEHVLFCRRKVPGEGYGLLHVAANEGVELTDVTATPVEQMLFRAAAEEAGVGPAQISDAVFTGVAPAGMSGWSIFGVVRTTLSSAELLDAARGAPDGWEGEPFVVPCGDVTRWLRFPQLWVTQAVPAHRLAGLAPP